MTDLKNGIIEINGFSIGPDTKVEELEKYFDIPARRDDSFSFFDFNKEIIMLNGIDFKLLISFDLEKISSIKLWPQIPEISNKYNLSPYSEEWLPYFKELRLILDEWLEKQLGLPSHKDDDCTEFKFEKMIIGTSSYMQYGKTIQPKGGKIDIWYV